MNRQMRIKTLRIQKNMEAAHKLAMNASFQKVIDL